MSDELCYRDTPHLRFPEIEISTLTSEKRELLNNTVTQAVSLRQLVNENAKDVLDGFAEGLSEPIWNLAWQEQYQLLQDQLVGQIQQLQKSISAWQQVFGFSEKQNLSQVNQDVAIFKAISNLVQQTDLKLLNAIKDIDLKTITQTKHLTQDLKQQRSSLVGKYQSQIYQADLSQIGFKWREAESKMFPFSWFAKFQLRNLVKTYQDSTQRPTALAVAHDLPILQHIQSQQLQFTECEKLLASKLGSYWQGEDSAWQSFEAIHNQWQEIKQIVALSITDQATLLKAVEFSKNHTLDELTQNIAQVENTFRQLLNDHVLKSDTAITSYSDIDFNKIIERQQQLQQHSSSWRHWLNWQAIKSQLIQHGLKPLAFELLNAPLNVDDALKRLNINLARHWITHQFSQHPELNQFNSQQHEQKIMSFAQQDKEHQLSASQEIIHRWNNIFIEQNHYKGQWTVLNKELGKKRRHIPVRESDASNS